MEILGQLIEGYLVLVERNIIHLDLKPENILRIEKTWKIADLDWRGNYRKEKPRFLTEEPMPKCPRKNFRVVGIQGVRIYGHLA